jgi:hypothetical protein
MPTPASRMLITASLSSRAAASRMLPPRSMYFAALLSRLHDDHGGRLELAHQIVQVDQVRFQA